MSLFWGDPAPYLRKAKNAGAIVIQTVATPEEAPRAAYFWTDIIVARGIEDGHEVVFQTEAPKRAASESPGTACPS